MRYPEGVRKALRRLLLHILAAAVTIAAPGLAPYEAAAQTMLRAGTASGSNAGGLGKAGAIEGANRFPGLLADVPARTTFLTPAFTAASPSADALSAPIPVASVVADGRADVRGPAKAVASHLSGPIEALERVRKTPDKTVDFDGDGGTRRDFAAVAERADGPGSAASSTLDPVAPIPAGGKTATSTNGVRYYVYETTRDHKIGALGHVIHYAIKIVAISSKAAVFYMASPLLAAAYVAFVILIPVKIVFFLKFQTTIDQTILRPWLGKREPVFSSRREVLLPHEELWLIPGVVKTIDASIRHDTSYGFLRGFLGAFMTRRVEEFKVLVMADRAMPAEILAQDGALLGRMTEVGAGDNLVFRARSRFGELATSWKRTVAQVFAGDVIDGRTAGALRGELDGNWMRTALLKLIKLALTTAVIGFGVMYGLEFLHAEKARDFAEIAAMTYFIMTGVYQHSNGPKVFDRYFGPNKVEGSRRRRVVGFVRDAWKESVGHHENAVTMARETDSGEAELGEIARGMGAHSLVGNGPGRQLIRLSPWLLGAAAIALMPLSGPAAAGVLSAAAAAAFIGALRAPRASTLGIMTRTNRGADPVWTRAVLLGILVVGLSAAAFAVGMFWVSVSLISTLAAVAIVLDPFSTNAKAYDMSLKANKPPIAWALFMAVALGAGAVLLAAQPAAIIVAGESLVVASAAALILILRMINPSIDKLKTPRSTPALAKN